VGNELRNSRIF